MYTKLCVLLLAIGLSQAVPKVLMPEVGLMKFMMSTRETSQDNAARSLECLNTYMPLVTQLGEEFKAELEQCVEAAETLRQGVDEETKSIRAQIDASATGACAALTECSQLTGSVEYFKCYINAGNENTMTMYKISADSSEELTDVEEKLATIDVNEHKCSNSSERVYVEKQAALFADFDRCNKGLEPLSTTAKPTDAPSTDAPTSAPTDAPTSAPTDAPTSAPTDAPTSAPTDAPTSAPTDAPTSAPTDAPTSAPTDAPTSAPTDAPTSAPTDAPTSEPTEAPNDKDNLPEEDLSRIAQEENKLKQMVEDMKKWFNRH